MWYPLKAQRISQPAPRHAPSCTDRHCDVRARCLLTVVASGKRERRMIRPIGWNAAAVALALTAIALPAAAQTPVLTPVAISDRDIQAMSGKYGPIDEYVEEVRKGALSVENYQKLIAIRDAGLAHLESQLERDIGHGTLNATDRQNLVNGNMSGLLDSLKAKDAQGAADATIGGARDAINGALIPMNSELGLIVDNYIDVLRDVTNARAAMPNPSPSETPAGNAKVQAALDQAQRSIAADLYRKRTALDKADDKLVNMSSSERAAVADRIQTAMDKGDIKVDDNGNVQVKTPEAPAPAPASPAAIPATPNANVPSADAATDDGVASNGNGAGQTYAPAPAQRYAPAPADGSADSGLKIPQAAIDADNAQRQATAQAANSASAAADWANNRPATPDFSGTMTSATQAANDISSRPNPQGATARGYDIPPLVAAPDTVEDSAMNTSGRPPEQKYSHTMQVEKIPPGGLKIVEGEDDLGGATYQPADTYDDTIAELQAGGFSLSLTSSAGPEPVIASNGYDMSAGSGGGASFEAIYTNYKVAVGDGGSSVALVPSTQVITPSSVMTAPSNQVATPSPLVDMPGSQVLVPSTQVLTPSSVMTAPSTQVQVPSNVMGQGTLPALCGW